MEEGLLESLIDDVIFCECLQVQKAAKMGLIFVEPTEEMYRIKDGPGLDVFGQPLSKKKQYNCTCPNCGRNLAASRLAPHLEKCIRKGPANNNSNNSTGGGGGANNNNSTNNNNSQNNKATDR